MPLSSLPRDNVLEGKKGFFPGPLRDESHEKLSRTWTTWMNNLKNLVNFGENPSANTDITAAGGIKLTTNDMRIQSATAGAIIVSANPQISPGFDNQKISLEGLSDVKTVQITNGNGLKLAGGASFTIGEDDTISLHFNKAKNLWIEDSRSDN